MTSILLINDQQIHSVPLQNVQCLTLATVERFSEFNANIS